MEKFGAVLREARPQLPRAGYRLLSGIEGDTIHDIANRDRQAGPSDLDHHQLGGVPRKLPIRGRSGCGIGTRSRNRVDPYGGGAISCRPRPRNEEFRTLAGLRTWLQRAIS
jgi:hypothetical protein